MKIQQMKVHLTNKCDLKCSFCLTSDRYLDPDYESSLEAIIKSIEFILDMGVINIELGVLIGEVFQLDFDTLQVLFEYLESNEKVNTVSVSTNLVFFRRAHLELVNRISKLRLQVSWYGKDKDQYIKNTKSDSYRKFILASKLLMEVKTPVKLTLLKMFPGCINKNHEVVSLYKQLPHNIDFELDESVEIYNWEKLLKKEQIKDNSHRKGACKYLFCDSGILFNGDVSICAWVDFNSMGIIGNISSESPDQIKKNHKKVVDQHQLGIFTGPCRNCDFYDTSYENIVTGEEISFEED